MKTHDFYYDLPEELIAQTPVEPRDHSRMLVVRRENGRLEHRHFYDIADYLRPGDVLVVNDNLAHYRGEVEIVLTEIENDGQRNLAGRIADTDMRILDEMEKRPDHVFEII